MIVRIEHIDVSDAFRLSALISGVFSIILAVCYFGIALVLTLLGTGGRVLVFEVTSCVLWLLVVIGVLLIGGLTGATIAILYNVIAAVSGGGVTIKLQRAKPEPHAQAESSSSK